MSARRVGVVGAAAAALLVGGTSLSFVLGGSSSAEAGAPEASALIDSGVAHLKRTTISYPAWLSKKYGPGVRETTEWARAFADFDAAKKALEPAPPPTTTTVPPPPTTEPPPTTAPPPSGTTIAAGQSWQTAYNNAAAGSTLTVLPGNHGVQRVVGSKAMTFLGQDGAVLRQLWNEVTGLTLDNVDIDGAATRETILESHGANATYRNLEIRNNTDRQMVGNYGDNGSYTNVFFHDAVITDAGEAGGAHMECVWSNGPAAKFRNNVFKDCAIMDLYLTYGSWWTPPQPMYTDVVVDDNIFWPSERANNTGEHFYGFLVNGNMNVTGWTIRRNRFDNSVGAEDSQFTNSTICGNTGDVQASWKVAC